MTIESAETIRQDVSFGDDDTSGHFNAAEAFLARSRGDDNTSSTDDEEEATTEDQGDTGSDVETTEEGEGETDATEGDDPDDTEVEIKVGDKVEKAKLSQLKRLFGQEAALTQKSQKAAEATKIAEAKIERADVAMNAMLKKAEEAYTPYRELDFMVLSQRMGTEEFQALRNDEAVARANLVFLQTEVDGLVKSRQQEVQQARHAQAQETIKVLTDPDKGIPGFSQPLYNEMVGFAQKMGVPGASDILDPAALRVLHMAMSYAKEQEAKASAATKVKAAVNTAKRVLKPVNASSTTTQASSEMKKAMNKIKTSNDPADFAQAFLLRSRGQ